MVMENTNTVIARETVLNIGGTDQNIKPANLEAAIDFFTGLYDTDDYTVRTNIIIDTMTAEESARLEDEAL